MDHGGGWTDGSEEKNGAVCAAFSRGIFRIPAGRRNCGRAGRRATSMDRSDVIRSPSLARSARYEVGAARGGNLAFRGGFDSGAGGV